MILQRYRLGLKPTMFQTIAFNKINVQKTVTWKYNLMLMLDNPRLDILEVLCDLYKLHKQCFVSFEIE